MNGKIIVVLSITYRDNIPHIPQRQWTLCLNILEKLYDQHVDDVTPTKRIKHPSARTIPIDYFLVHTMDEQ